MFSKALERDPTLAPAATGKAGCLFWAGQSRWADDPEASLRYGLRCAQDAVLADAAYPVAHLLLGQNLLFLGEQDAAIAAAQHAIGLNASYAGGWAFLGHALTAAGNARAAIRSIRRAFSTHMASIPGASCGFRIWPLRTSIATNSSKLFVLPRKPYICNPATG